MKKPDRKMLLATMLLLIAAAMTTAAGSHPAGGRSPAHVFNSSGG